MEKITSLSIDLETRSGVDISKSGVYRYAEDFDFDILLFGVSVNHGPVKVYDLACGETLPQEMVDALLDPAVEKWAYNSSFERICLSAWLHKRYLDRLQDRYLNPDSWKCSLVWGAYNGLPLGLERIGDALGLEQQKLKEGQELIRYFCCPCETTEADDGRTWNLPRHAPDQWELFKRYNQRDVEVELQIQDRLKNYPVPDFVWAEYHLDQRINDTGIRIDREMVEQALHIDEMSKTELTARLKDLTGLENPGSVSQLKAYLADQGLAVESLGKKEVARLMATASDSISSVLALRLQLAKSSVRKYEAMKNAVCFDGRCHGLFQFYGANRTGRWAGRLIQLQNLPQNHLPDLEQARDLVKQGDYEMLHMLYESVSGVLSELIRTALIPKDGYKFIVADYSAIEARVLSFLAQEQWRIDVFHAGRDIYCESASRMFGVPVKKNGINGHLRQRGKIAELALGYGGALGALKAMGGEEMGLTELEMQSLVSMWREANPHITAFWWAVDDAAKTAVRLRIPQQVGNLRFEVHHGMMFITLPSGRKLAYVKPRLEQNMYGGESITYLGNDKDKNWSRIETYGPKLVENIVQAISRDILAAAMKRLQGYRIVAHVHDELIIEAPMDASLDEVCDLMGQAPAWLPGIELRADGYECPFYQTS